MVSKKQVTLFIFLFFSSGLMTVLNGQSIIKNEVDEFTGNRVIQSDYERIEHDGFSGRAFVSAFYNEGTYLLVLTVRSNDSWQLLSTDAAYFIIDGERESYNINQFESDVSNDSTMMQYSITLSESEFESFGKAEEIKFRINRNVYTLSQEAIKSFSLVLDTLKE